MRRWQTSREVLQRFVLDRTAVDQTGIAGRFDFVLRWTPDNFHAVGKPSPAVEPVKDLRKQFDRNADTDILRSQLYRPRTTRNAARPSTGEPPGTPAMPSA